MPYPHYVHTIFPIKKKDIFFLHVRNGYGIGLPQSDPFTHNQKKRGREVRKRGMIPVGEVP